MQEADNEKKNIVIPKVAGANFIGQKLHIVKTKKRWEEPRDTRKPYS